MCRLRQGTGAVRPTTARAWRKVSAWHSPSTGVGPGSGGVVSVGSGVGVDEVGAGSSTGASAVEVHPASRTAAARAASARLIPSPAPRASRPARTPPPAAPHPRRRGPRARAPPGARGGPPRSTAPTAPRPSCRSGRARRARTASCRPRGRGRPVVGEGATGLEEDRVEEVLEGPAHVAEVRGGAEHVRVRGEHVARTCLECRPYDDLDALDRVVRRARDDRLGQRGPPTGWRVVDHQQSGHGVSLRGGVASRGVTFEVSGDAYDRFMGRYSRPLAADLADWLEVDPGQRAIDVGCGPGALTDQLVTRARSRPRARPSSVDVLRGGLPRALPRCRRPTGCG